MRITISAVMIACLCAAAAFAQGVQSDLQKLVATEKAFAALAAEKSTKEAFLTYLADDGIIFNPTEVNGRLSWKGRPDSPALLAWNPVWADVSSDGKLGYTTGGWEFRPKGKSDKPSAFGEYLTIWKRQADGQYRAVLDIGIGHPSNTYNANAGWRSPYDAGRGASARDGVEESIFTEIFSNKSMANGYFNFFAEDVVMLRENNLPFNGRKSAFIGLERMEKDFPDSSYLDFNANRSKVSGNMMYSWGTYRLTHKDKSVSRWNFVQIWKHRNGKWQIVADVFNKIGK